MYSDIVIELSLRASLNEQELLDLCWLVAFVSCHLEVRTCTGWTINVYPLPGDTVQISFTHPDLFGTKVSPVMEIGRIPRTPTDEELSRTPRTNSNSEIVAEGIAEIIASYFNPEVLASHSYDAVASQ